ncbi:ATP-binding protein [Actinoplanes sp. NPDC049548]|uniref:hybrid sensor histidine kinase/response regulator n=1 Tax=Actinoplanes sp. NPDC049548 TaxID=3155152 RepID=UPI003441B1E9
MATVLVAEDDPDHQRLIAGVIRREGHDVMVAGDGRAALLATAHRRPDLVVADVDMPEMDGLQLCRALRADPDLADVPIVLVTAFSLPGDTRLSEAGATAVIRKPFTLQELGKALSPHLGEASARSPAAHMPLLEDAALDPVFVEALLQSVDTGLAACDADGRMILLNPTVREFFGDTSEAVPLDEWAKRFALRHHDGTELSAEDLPMTRALAGEVVEQSGLLATDRHGRQRWLTINARPVRDWDGAVVGAVAAVQDITLAYRSRLYQACKTEVLKALAESTSAAEARAQVVRTVGDMLGWRTVRLWLVDPVTDRLRVEAVYTGPNERPLPIPASMARGEGLAGQCWQRGELLWVTDLHAEDSPVLPEVVAATEFRAGGAVPVRSGEHITGVMTFFSYDQQEPEPALALLLTGVAGSIGAHVQQHRADDLAHHLAAATDEYVALVGHELRTPLTSISAYIELLAEAPGLTPDLRELAQVVDRNSRRLRDLVDQLLDLAALDAGHRTITVGEVNLTEVTGAAVAAAGERRITFETRLMPGLTMTGDSDRLRQVVDNLVDNAVKFSPDGSTVTVDLTGDDETIVLTVTDNGIGLPGDDRPALFRRLYRGDNARHSGIPGNGLGLALCRAVVERHHGTITLSRHEPAGTTVTVRLPRLHG